MNEEKPGPESAIVEIYNQGKEILAKRQAAFTARNQALAAFESEEIKYLAAKGSYDSANQAYEALNSDSKSNAVALLAASRKLCDESQAQAQAALNEAKSLKSRADDERMQADDLLAAAKQASVSQSDREKALAAEVKSLKDKALVQVQEIDSRERSLRAREAAIPALIEKAKAQAREELAREMGRDLVAGKK